MSICRSNQTHHRSLFYVPTLALLNYLNLITAPGPEISKGTWEHFRVSLLSTQLSFNRGVSHVPTLANDFFGPCLCSNRSLYLRKRLLSEPAGRTLIWENSCFFPSPPLIFFILNSPCFLSPPVNSPHPHVPKTNFQNRKKIKNFKGYLVNPRKTNTSVSPGPPNQQLQK